MSNKYKYLSLTPMELDASDTNVQVLKEQVANKDIKNIAVMAPYGAGKSSVLRTFEKEYGKKNCINVSLASFNSDVNDGNSDAVSDKIIKDIDNQVEKSVLQQILYKKEKKDLPQSKIKRIGRPSLGQIILMSVCVLFGVLSVASGILFSLQISGTKLFKICSQTYFLISFICALICIGGFVFSRKISKLSYGDIDVEFNGEEKKSLLNKFLNEIIYFFQKTNYNTVIFEDLDRFKNLDIFVKLRELNILLNDNEVVAKKHKITFVYAISNSMFKHHTERTKFFDFLLPLVPVLSPLNVKDDLVKSLDESGLGEEWLSPEFIYDISQYIKEKRVLNSIINDCITMINVLDLSKISGGSLRKKQDQLFALMAYKNICPREFALLEDGNGELIDVIEKAHTLALINIKSIDEKIALEAEKIDNCKQSISNSLNQIRFMIKGWLLSQPQRRNYYGGAVAIETINDIPENKDARICSSMGSYYSATIEQVEQALGIPSLKQLWDSVKIRENENIKAIEEKIQLLTVEKNNSTTDGFSYLYGHSKEVFSLIKSTALLKMLLVNQYITEYYRDYIGRSGEEFLSTNDRILVQKVLENSEPNFELKLTSPELILRDLSDKKFGRKAMLNRNIINSIFSSVKISITQRQQFCNLLLKEDSLVEECFVQYFEKSNEWNKSFVEFLIGRRADFLDVIKSHVSSKELLNRLLTFVLINFDASILSKQNNSVFYNEVLSDSVAIMPFIYKKDSTLDFLKQNGFKFYSILDCKDVKVLNQIEKYDLWSINSVNLLHLLKTTYGISDELALSKGLSLINKMTNGAAKYINENLSHYVKEVLSKQEQIDMEESDVIACIENETLEMTVRNEIARKIAAPILYNSYINIEIVKTLLVADKILLNCEEIVKLRIDDSSIEEQLCVYLFNHRDEISLQFKLFDELAYMIANCHKKFIADGKEVSLYDIYKDNLAGYSWKIIKLDNDELIHQVVVANSRFMVESMRHIIDGHYPKSLSALVKTNVDDIINNNLCNYKVAFSYFMHGDNKTKKESSIIMYDLLGVNSETEARQIFEQTINENIKLSKELREKLISLGVDASAMFDSQVDYLNKEDALAWAKEIDPNLEPLEREGYINGTIDLNDSIIIKALCRMNYAHRVGNGLRRYKIEVS